MHVLLATIGTDGDVFPYLGLACHLLLSGHDVTVAGSEHYRQFCSDHRIPFIPLASRDEIDRVLGNPDFWHPWKAPQLAASWGARLIPQQYRSLASAITKPGTVLVASPAVLAARVIHDKLGTPFASIVLQPWLLPSVHRPAIMPGGMMLPRWSPRWLWGLYIAAFNRLSDLLVGRKLNALRHELSLPSVRGVLSWWLSPQLILGLFPAWYGPTQPDWPSQVRTLSFPHFDGTTQTTLPPPIASFLADGSPPVAITFGTGIRHAASLYRSATDACRRLGRRALIITKYPEQIPRPLPADFLALPYAPFSELFPKCAAVIHHGGIGTTARALRARVPQLVIPVCFDQLDNATRVRELLCGDFLPLKKAHAANIAASLQPLLARSVGSHLPQTGSDHDNPFVAAERLLLQLLAR